MKDKPVILIVDDEPQDIELLEAHLVPQGYEIVKAASGEEALEKLSSNQIDLILLDVLMPGMDGFEVTRRIRRDTAHRLIPIILITALQETEDRVKGIEAGCDDFLSKPLDKMELFARVRSLLQVKAYNDLMMGYQIELEAMVTSRTEELRHALENLQQEIAERKRVEQALRQTEKRFRMVMKDSSIIVAHIDQDLRYTWIYNAHPAFEEEAVLGKRDDEIAVNEGTHQLVQLKRKSIESGTSARSEITFSLPGGEITYDIMVEPIRDEKGVVIGATTVAFDVTERKQAEQTLRDSESKYRLLAENVSDVIYTLDMDLKYTYISPSVKPLQGFDPAELLNKPANDTVTSSSVELIMKTLSEIMELEKSGHDEIPVSRTLAVETIRKDGTTVWTEEKFSLIKDEKKQPVGILGISRDITDRKRSEEKLQQTLESLNKALNTTIQVLVSAVDVRDPYTAGHQQRVADLSCAIAKEMGYSRDRIAGLHMAGAIHDIGKLSVPSEILAKPTRLSAIEFALIKEHPRSGYEMLKDVESPWPLAEIAHQHHERIDGSGYPHGLKGEEILMEARIMAVADVVESMASHRPYRPALGIEAALEEIEKNKGILYDETVTDACLSLFREKSFNLKRHDFKR